VAGHGRHLLGAEGGHVLYGYGGHPTGAQEVTRDHRVVWNYFSKSQQVFGCERLATR
jgi:hypothetical protein